MKDGSTAAAKPRAHHFSRQRGGGIGNGRTQAVGGNIITLIQNDAVNKLQTRVSVLEDGLRQKLPEQFRDREGYLVMGDDVSLFNSIFKKCVESCEGLFSPTFPAFFAEFRQNLQCLASFVDCHFAAVPIKGGVNRGRPEIEPMPMTMIWR